MALRTLLRSHPAYGSLGSTQVLGSVGFQTATGLGFPALPFTILAGNTQSSDPILVHGWDCFMLVVTYTGVGGTTTWEYGIMDPQAQTLLVARTISAATAPGTLVFSFGAASSTAPVATRGDAFHTINLRATANTQNQTITALLFWAGVR